MFVPFVGSFTLASLANSTDILSFFNEYLIKSVRLEIQSLIGDSAYNPGGSAVLIPEAITVIDPGNAPAPTFSAENLLAFANSNRSVLTLARPHRTRCQPRLSLGASLILIPTKATEFWAIADTPFYGINGGIRNWFKPTGSAIPFPVRFSLTVEIHARRPR